ncbi:MAG TPA: hypothetical protein VFP01_06900, partial [Propionibacteriaceae bacterium]|nr:hypothetical protein [Propionibacteriaceae bacterium]
MRSLDDWAPTVLVRLVRLGSTLSVVFDPSWLRVADVWLTPAPGTALTVLTELDVEAEPAEMLAAQQTETRPTAAVTAAMR